MPGWKVRLYRKINKTLDRHLTSIRKKRIYNMDFTIISNNCWAGAVYRRYGLPYKTPTVGLYFFADDYIRFCSDLKAYLEKDLVFIQYTDSKYKRILERRKHTNIPIARLGDIEVFFLHYATIEEAEEKWKRRASRVNYDNLIYKFSAMNECAEEHLIAFDQLDVHKKICFIPARSASRIRCGICYKNAEGNEVIDDTSEYSRYINLTKMINAKEVCGTHMEGQWNK